MTDARKRAIAEIASKLETLADDLEALYQEECDEYDDMPGQDEEEESLITRLSIITNDMVAAYGDLQDIAEE